MRFGLPTPLRMLMKTRPFIGQGHMTMLPKEVKAVRENLGASEVASFANHKFTGSGARAFLDRILAGHMPERGRVNLSPMLLESGKLNGDLTVACIDDETYYLFGSSVAQKYASSLV